MVNYNIRKYSMHIYQWKLLDNAVIKSVNSLNLLNNDHSSWDKGTQACKYLADELRTGI
jgi:hypothetical protein